MMNEKHDIRILQGEIEAQLLSAGADLVGFADISDAAPAGQDLPRAVSIVIAYDPGVVQRLDEEVDAFEKHLRDTKERMGRLLGLCESRVKESGFRTWVPPISPNLPGLISDFSHKTAATKAGLGWIGKNALFVSKEFGCGMRMASVLTDAPLIPGSPVTENHCGKCIECVKACPYSAIKGATWYPGISREELLDAFLCSEKREEHMARLGYKHPCGLCIKACPTGARKK
jgi:epoxyqueuosine reductase